MNELSKYTAYDLSGHVALITGANHGIGAATAKALAKCGASVLITYLCLSDPPDFPEVYRTNRAKDAGEVLSAIQAFGGEAKAMEVDLRDASKIRELFEFAETTFGSVDILVNNATSWVADTFAPDGEHVSGLSSVILSPDTHDCRHRAKTRFAPNNF